MYSCTRPIVKCISYISALIFLILLYLSTIIMVNKDDDNFKMSNQKTNKLLFPFNVLCYNVVHVPSTPDYQRW